MSEFDNSKEATAVTTDPEVSSSDQKVEAKTESAKDLYFKRLRQKIAEFPALGSMLVQGIEGEEEEEGDDTKYSEEQISTLRHILIVENRDVELQAAVDFASLGQHGFGVYNTASGNEIIEKLPAQIEKAMDNEKTLPQRFDSLFALTFAISSFDHWMHDNEYGGDNPTLSNTLNQLANSWKLLLSKEDQELGIDTEFTRPGIEKLVEKFAIKVQEALKETTPNYQFVWI